MRKRADHIEEIKDRNNSSQRTRKPRSPLRMEPIDKARILLEIIRSRRSVRFFKDTPIPDEHLMMILEGARWAPSAANAQPWEFLVIKNQRIKRNLMDMMKKVGKVVKKRHPEFPWGRMPRDPCLISEVAIIIAVCADFNRKELRKYDVLPLKHKKEIVNNSIAAAIQNMILTAKALGIGSLWITPVSTSKIKRLLGIPESLELFALVPLGYPAEDQIEETSRRPLETLVHYDEIKASQIP